MQLEGGERLRRHRELFGQLSDLGLDRGGGPGRRGLLPSGEGHQVGEQLRRGVVGDQQGSAHDLLERLGVDLDRGRRIGRGALGDLTGDLDPGIGQELREPFGGVAGRVERFRPVLLAVQPSAVKRERRGGGHPAVGGAVVAPGRVVPTDQIAVVVGDRDLVDLLSRCQLGRLGREIAQLRLTESHVTAAHEGDHTVLDRGPRGEHLVAAVLAKHRRGGEELEGRGGHESGAGLALGDHFPAVGIDHAEGETSVDDGQRRPGCHAFFEVSHTFGGSRWRGGGQQILGAQPLPVLGDGSRAGCAVLLDGAHREHPGEGVGEVSEHVEARGHRRAHHDRSGAPDTICCSQRHAPTIWCSGHYQWPTGPEQWSGCLGIRRDHRDPSRKSKQVRGGPPQRTDPA